jgi:hypothetical protein
VEKKKMKTNTEQLYSVSRSCSQTRQHEWTESLIVKATSAEQAAAFAEQHHDDWIEDKDSHREEEHYKWPDVQYEHEECGESLEAEPVGDDEFIGGHPISDFNVASATALTDFEIEEAKKQGHFEFTHPQDGDGTGCRMTDTD